MKTLAREMHARRWCPNAVERVRTFYRGEDLLSEEHADACLLHDWSTTPGPGGSTTWTAEWWCAQTCPARVNGRLL